jgi:hypothetical protein
MRSYEASRRNVALRLLLREGQATLPSTRMASHRRPYLFPQRLQVQLIGALRGHELHRRALDL